MTFPANRTPDSLPVPPPTDDVAEEIPRFRPDKSIDQLKTEQASPTTDPGIFPQSGFDTRE